LRKYFCYAYEDGNENEIRFLGEILLGEEEEFDSGISYLWVEILGGLWNASIGIYTKI